MNVHSFTRNVSRPILPFCRFEILFNLQIRSLNLFWIKNLRFGGDKNPCEMCDPNKFLPVSFTRMVLPILIQLVRYPCAIFAEW